MAILKMRAQGSNPYARILEMAIFKTCAQGSNPYARILEMAILKTRAQGSNPYARILEMAILKMRAQGSNPCARIFSFRQGRRKQPQCTFYGCKPKKEEGTRILMLCVLYTVLKVQHKQ